MPVDPLELLDRQYGRLQQLSGAAFVPELKRFHAFLTEGPDAVTAAMAELRAAADAAESAFQQYDERLIPELVALRDELVARAPEIDDSGLPRPDGRTISFMEWTFGLSNFDQVAVGGPERHIMNEDYDASASRMLARILEQKLRRLQWTEVRPDGLPQPSETNLRPEFDDLAMRLSNLNERHRHAAQTFSQAAATSAGFQVRLLDMVVEQMNPLPQEVHTDAEREARFNDLFVRAAAGWYAIEDAAAGRAVGQASQLFLQVHEDKLKPAAEKVYEDLRLKLATAPLPPAPTPTYGQRLHAWVLSAGYALTGGPCIAGMVSGVLTQQTAGFGGFVALAIVFAFVPPVIAQLPVMDYTRRRALAVAGAVGLAVVVLVLFGTGVGLGVFALLAVGFVVGQWVAA